MTWRLAKSLEKLREQINATHPRRSKASDGTIGDAAHAKTVSDHNPNSAGVVTALDITHDPANGVDIDKLSDALAESRDPRIKYLIANGLILVPADYGWTWQPYTGPDPHTSHLHVSVYGDYDNTREWNIGEETMPKIPDNDAWYNRYKKLMMQIRGRKSDQFTREEFRKNFVGQEAFRMVEVMSDNPEADRALKWQQAGRDAVPTEAQKKLDKVKEIING